VDDGGSRVTRQLKQKMEKKKKKQVEFDTRKTDRRVIPPKFFI
jgi:hypothetical protein